MQNVPVTITALSGEQLARASLRSTEDLRTLVPGLNIGGQRRDDGQFFIRGQGPGVALTGPRNFTSVATYFAEVPATVSGPGVFYDLANVQVLKGPQGTLFGRNTTGGAVLFEPNRPTWDDKGYAQVTIGNYDYKQFDGVLNVAPLPDILAIRLATQISRRDGYTTSAIGQKLDGRNYEAIRASFLLTPGAGIESNTIIDYRSKDNSSTSAIIRAINPGQPFGAVLGIPLRAGGVVSVGCLSAALPGCPAGGAAGAIALASNGGDTSDPANSGFYLVAPTSQMLAAVAAQQALGARRTLINEPLRSKQLDYGITNRTSVEITDEITLRNIIAYRVSRKNEAADYDGTPIPFINNMYTATQPWGTGLEQFTEEFQVQGHLPSARLEYILGFYHEFTKPGFLQNVPGITLGNLQTRRFSSADESNAVFGHLEWNPTQWLGVSGGIRQTWDKRSALASVFNAAGACAQQDPATAGNPFTCPISFGANFHALTYDATINIKPTDRVLIYGSYRRGYKAGGINVPAAPGDQIFAPEKVDSFEIGLKGDWNIGFPVRTEIAGFYDKYRDIQTTQSVFFNGLNLIRIPAGIKAINKGFEATVTVVPVRAFSLTGFVSYLDAAATADFPANCTPATCLIFRGRQFSYQPKWKYGVNGVLTAPIPEDYGQFSLSADYSWQSKVFDNYVPGLVPTYPSYGLLNARINWNSVMNSRFDLSVFATNLTNKLYIQGGYPIPALAFDAVYYGEPRMYGVSLKVNLGDR